MYTFQDALESAKEKLRLAQHDEERFRTYMKQLETHKKEQEIKLQQMEEETTGLGELLCFSSADKIHFVYLGTISAFK